MREDAAYWGFGGAAHTAIVEVLADGQARTGLEIIQAKPILGNPLLYNLLRAMEQRGVIHSYWDETTRGRKVRYQIRSDKG